MRERQALERQITAYKQMEQELDDAITLIELGEAENDEETIAEGEAALKLLRERAQRREVEALLSGEADANDAYPRNPRRRRRDREPGLGRNARTDVHALG